MDFTRRFHGEWRNYKRSVERETLEEAGTLVTRSKLYALLIYLKLIKFT